MTDQMTEQNKDSILFASKASQLIQEDKIEDALSLCEAGVRQFPFYSPGHYTLGLCYEAMGKAEDAKNEYERTLVYDPSHNKAMRKLSNFYQKSGLDQLANELLIKEAIYSPLNPEIMDILKEKNLYDQLNPANGSTPETIDDVTTEVEIENEISINDVEIQSIEEIEEPAAEIAIAETEEEQVETSVEEEQTIETLVEEEQHVETSVEEEQTIETLVEEEQHVETSVEEEQTIETLVEEEQHVETSVEEEQHVVADEPLEEESGPIDDLDPLAGEELDAEDEMIIDNPSGSVTEDISDDIQDREDFSPLMQGYLEKDEEEDDDDDEQWMEVENLLNGEEELTETDVDPVPDGPKDETEMLLEQLSQDDDINLEAGVADPYDQIDLTSEVDKTKVDAEDIDIGELAAAVEDPLEKTASQVPQEKTVSETTEEEVGETISEIVSEFEQEDEIPQQENNLADEENALDIDEPVPDILSQEKIEDEPIAESTDIAEESKVTESKADASLEENEDEDELTDELDDEVTVGDMLKNPNLVTPTFGEILIAQHKFSEARHVFVELSKKEPENSRFMKKIQFLDKFLQAE